MKNFIILIGGPGKFQGCDKKHDQTWTNYIVPMQLAAARDLYKKESTETVHWVVYEPAYRDRWLDDSVITTAEAKQSDGYWLHSIRKQAADDVKVKGATSYIHRIKMIAASQGIVYEGISTPLELWNYLATFPINSLSQIWYSGHASGSALLLALTHDSSCGPVAAVTDVIYVRDIRRNSSLSNKFVTGSTPSSKFYGCYTDGFAKEWNDVFGVPAEGAVNKVDFGSVDRKSNIPNVLERIQQTGSPGWKIYP